MQHFKLSFVAWFSALLICVSTQPNKNNAAENLSVSAIELIPKESVHEIKSESQIKAAGRGSFKAVLTPTELEGYTNSLKLIKDNKCRYDLNATLYGIYAGARWAVAMYDATAKSSNGVESGVLHNFGHFDECLEQLPDAPIRSQYCLVNVRLDGLTVRSIGARSKKAMNSTVAHWGTCLPASCSGAGDIATYLEHFLQRPVLVDEKMCQLQGKGVQISESMFIYAVVIFFFVFLAVLSTAYHAYLIYASKQNDTLSKTVLKNDALTMALLSFSIVENTKKLFQASKDQVGLNSINGIKALAMLFILAGHALSFIYGGPMYNADFINENVKLPTFTFLTNSLLFVDTFLLLSGFLFCRILLVELERRHGRINVLILYVARYIRLTPAYMAIIGFYMTWFPHVGSGPLWTQRIVREQERCTASWWLNILYINNYVNTDKLCMFQSWYLSVDTQLFFIAPIFIYLLYKSRKAGLRYLIALVVTTAAIPFIVTYKRGLDPTLLVYQDEMTDLGSNAFYIGSYIKTHMRASAYVLGLLTGFLVHKMQEKNIRLSRPIVSLCWLLATIIGTSSMITVSCFYTEPYSVLESMLYAGFHKIGWNLSIGWLVLAATTGHAGWLQYMLSSRFFAPISRLTYCAYLSNGIVELYHSSSIRSPGYMGYITLSNSVLGHISDTFVLAILLCLLFESPIHALERILLRKHARSSKHGGSKTAANKQQGMNSQTPSTSEEQVA